MGIPMLTDFAQMGAKTILPIYRRRQEEADARAAAQAKGDLLDARAARKERDAEDAVKIGFLDQADQVRGGKRDIAGTRAQYAASGVKVDSGSAADVASDKAAWNELGRQRIAYEADLKSWGLEYDAALLRAEASAARAGAHV